MIFVEGAFASWLLGQVANAGRKRLVESMRGTEHDRALEQAAHAAIQSTAKQWYPGKSDELASVIDQVFRSDSLTPQMDHATVLQGLYVGITAQLSILDDVNVTGTGKSSADLLGVSGSALATSLTSHLVQEIRGRGAIDGPLTPLASRLSDDNLLLRIESLHNELKRHISTKPYSLEYGKVLLPTPPALREIRDPKTGMISFVTDASILIYLIEEFVRIGAIDIAVDAYRYENVLPTLPAAFRHRIIQLDRAGTTEAVIKLHRPCRD